MGTELLPLHIRDNYDVYEWKHACAILSQDFPLEWNDRIDVLSAFRLRKSYIDIGGGNKSAVSGYVDKEFYRRGWIEKSFDTKIVIDNQALASPTHKVDCYKNQVAFEIEWNNKDHVSSG